MKGSTGEVQTTVRKKPLANNHFYLEIPPGDCYTHRKVRNRNEESNWACLIEAMVLGNVEPFIKWNLFSILSEILIYQALHSQSVNKLRKLYCLRPQGDKNITRHGATSLSASMLR